jgi:hypothetical protein
MLFSKSVWQKIWIGGGIFALAGLIWMWSSNNGSMTNSTVTSPTTSKKTSQEGSVSSMTAEERPQQGSPAGSEVKTDSVTNMPSPSSSTASAENPVAQVRTFDEIITAKNDNDPRLDTTLKNLAPETKAQLRGRYDSFPKESRNSRGLVVFLIGREISTPEDVVFMSSVLNEPACLSLADCSKPSQVSHADHDGVHAGEGDQGGEVSLAYPQLVAVRMLGQWLRKNPEHPSRATAIASLESATKSENSALSSAAAATLSQLRR